MLTTVVVGHDKFSKVALVILHRYTIIVIASTTIVRLPLLKIELLQSIIGTQHPILLKHAKGRLANDRKVVTADVECGGSSNS